MSLFLDVEGFAKAMQEDAKNGKKKGDDKQDEDMSVD